MTLLYHKNMPRQTVLRLFDAKFGNFVQLPYFGDFQKAGFVHFAVKNRKFLGLLYENTQPLSVF